MDEDERLIGVNWLNQVNPKTKLLSNSILLNKKFFILLAAEVILGLNCVVGDYYIFDNDKLIKLINKNIGLSERLIRAVMDNGSHALIGLLSCFILTYPNLNLNELIISGLVSSLIDLDHFISARSFNLLNAISLPKRPFLHNSLTLAILNLILVFIAKFYQNENNLSLIVFISWFSHHVRDANRRGLWFGTLFTTPPIKDNIYLSIILFEPILFRYFINFNLDQFLSNFNYQTNKREIHLV